MSTLQLLKEKFPQAVEHTQVEHGDESAVIRPKDMLAVFRFLKEDPEMDFNILMDLAGMDYHRRRPRYEVVYHLYSLAKNRRLRVKVQTDDPHPEIDSLTPVWKAADWYEREVWDMFGIRFKSHPNLTRILLYESFQGHPLRKDYPINKRQPLVGPQN